MSAPAQAARVEPDADDFWERPRSAAEIRQRLAVALGDELGDRGREHRRRMRETFPEYEPPRYSPAGILFLADEYARQLAREALARMWETP